MTLPKLTEEQLSRISDKLIGALEEELDDIYDVPEVFINSTELGHDQDEDGKLSLIFEAEFSDVVDGDGSDESVDTSDEPESDE